MRAPNLIHIAIWGGVAVAILVAGFAAMIASSDFSPTVWRPGPRGASAENAALAGAVAFGADRLRGPEDIAVDDRGFVYAGTSDGLIWRADATQNEPRFERHANVGGRPLGLAVSADGTLYVANHGVGLQSVSPDGAVATLATEADGTPILFANDLTIGADGDIYFSDASSRYNNTTLGVVGTYSVPDLLEGRPYGRIIRYAPQSGSVETIARDLYFPNGVAISSDGASLIVVETNRYRLTRIWLEGDRAGERDVFIENLQGAGDGLTSLGDGRMLLAAYDRTPVLDDTVLPNWFMRHIMARLPNSFFARNAPRGYVAVIDDRTGVVLDELRGGSGAASAPSNAVLWRNELWLGTLFGSGVSRLRSAPDRRVTDPRR